MSQINYNKVVDFNRESNTITVLDYTFRHDDGFKGATGSKFEPISKTEYDQIMDEDFVDYLVDSGMDLPEEYMRTGFEGMAKDMSEEDKINFRFDTSYKELWDDIRKETGLTEEEAFIFNCVGGGRCFDKDFEGNINTELSEIIKQAES